MVADFFAIVGIGTALFYEELKRNPGTRGAIVALCLVLLLLNHVPPYPVDVSVEEDSGAMMANDANEVNLLQTSDRADPSRHTVDEVWLYEEEAAMGEAIIEEGPTETVFGQVFYHHLSFEVSESDPVQSLVYVNKHGCTTFTGAFFSPAESGDEDVTRFTIEVDGEMAFDSGEITKLTEPVPFAIDIASGTQIAITCYFVRGSINDIAAVVSANLADAKFSSA